MGKTKQTPAPVQDEEYEVERICGKQFQNKENCYEVKWKNFPITENTWEPASNLDCDELIAAYEASLVSKQETAAAQTPKAKKATTKGKILCFSFLLPIRGNVLQIFCVYQLFI